jgi:ADP-ribose pyrophosphatase YjhB (NUDIX family)
MIGDLPAYPELMRLALPARRAAIRLAYAGMRAYWFLVRPQLIGVKCVVTHGDDVLLVRHTYGCRDWDLPGGGVKRGEVPLDAARREMREELGRRIEAWLVLGQLQGTNNHHRDRLHVFQGQLEDRRVELDLTELSEAAWFPRDQLPAELARYVSEIMARAVRTA